jgi:hypothetical protein
MATMQLPREGELVYNREIQIETTHLCKINDHKKRQTTILVKSK